MAHESWEGARLSEPIPSSSRAEDLALAVTVARRYFVDDRTKVEIAAELKLSRFKVARLLDLARDSGLVRISIGTPGGVDVELSDQLRRRLGLTRAIVVNAVDGGDAEIREHLAGLTAELLEEILTPDDVLGLGWSRSALATAARLRRLPPCPVVQLTGALTSPDVSVNLIESVQAVARSGGGRGYTFYSPLFVADPASVDVITRQAEVADAFARFGQVTTAVVGIGSWQPVRSDLHDALTAEERAALQRRDVLADVCGTFLDAAGTTLSMPLTRQIIAIDAERLHAVRDVICVAYGRNTAAAVRTAVRAGYVTTLVTTAAFAQELLRPTEG
jgi:DNA-binding transcriptional regulator LsrR (DeoR family)